MPLHAFLQTYAAAFVLMTFIVSSILRIKKQRRSIESWNDTALCRKTGNIFVNKDGRDDRIRTCDLIVPNDALYQAEPHPDNNRYYTTKI
jgi:hypothetical protein